MRKAFLSLLLIFIACQLQAKVIFVSPDGSDDATGSKEAPLATFL